MAREGIVSLLERDRIIPVLTAVRRIVLRSLVVVVLSGAASFFRAKELLGLFVTVTGINGLYAFSLDESFYSLVEFALYSGVFFSIPVIAFLSWKELKGTVALKPAWGWVMVTAFVLLFYGGGFFSYWVILPSGISFLVGYEGGNIKAMISVERFVRFCTAMTFASAITFEIPLIMMVLARIGIVKSAKLRRTRRFAILFIAIAAAVITPTPDVYNMALLGVPMYILYEVGILLMKMVERKTTS